MLAKLIKYDFIEINKAMLVLYLIAILNTSIVLLTNGNGNDFLVALNSVFKDFTLIWVVIIIIIGFFSCYFRFKSSLYLYNAYLTYTLPVEKKTIYDAKMFTAFFTLVIAFIVVSACFISVYSGNNIINFLFNTYEDANKSLLNVFEAISHIALFFIFLFETFILGDVIANYFGKKKILLLFIVPIGTLLFIKLFFFILFEVYNLNYFPLVDIFLIIINIGLYYLGRRFFTKKFTLI